MCYVCIQCVTLLYHFISCACIDWPLNITITSNKNNGIEELLCQANTRTSFVEPLNYGWRINGSEVTEPLPKYVVSKNSQLITVNTFLLPGSTMFTCDVWQCKPRLKSYDVIIAGKFILVFVAFIVSRYFIT